MIVSVDDVRETLKNMPSEFVHDEVIEKQIEIAAYAVNKEASSAATTEDIYMATLICSCHLTLLAYASEVERSLGVVAPSLGALIERYRVLCKEAMEYLSRGTAVMPPMYAGESSSYDVSESLWKHAGAVAGVSDE